MLQRSLIIWLTLSSAVAFYWPQWFPAMPDVFVESKRGLPWLIVVTMLAIGMMLPRDEVRQVILRWPTVLAGTALQYVTMPLLAFAFGHLAKLQGDYLIGVVMVGCVPGAMASNVLTINAGGNASYSVSLTTSATLLSPVAVPLAMGIALRSEKSVDVGVLLDTSVQLIWTVVLPVIVGHLVGRRYTKWESKIRFVGTLVANLVILWIIAVVVGLNRQPLSQLRLDLFIVLAAINAGGYLAGYAGGVAMQLPEPMRRALTLEIGMQNAGLGAVLATQLFDKRVEIAIAPAMYTFGCMLTGTLLAGFWSWRRVAASDHAASDAAGAD